MRNKRINHSWNKIKPNKEADRRMLKNILMYKNSQNSKKGKMSIMYKRPKWQWLTPIIACSILVIGVLSFIVINGDSNAPLPENNAIPQPNNSKGEFELKLSNGAKVKYEDNPPKTLVEASLLWYSEEELLAPTYNEKEIVIFEGVVQELHNIVINISGRRDYKAIATIEVTDALRGKVERGKQVTVLLPGPINKGDVMEDGDVYTNIKVGTRGVFTPMTYDEDTIIEIGNSKFVYKDVADYGFPDGRRYMFLETTNGLEFAAEAYPSFEQAKDLNDVKEIIKKKLK